MAIAPPEFRIQGRDKIHKAINSDDGDSRGLIYLFEPPSPRSRYIMGVDATQGRTGWSRYNRTEDDTGIDNGAIEVLRCGRGEPGKQGFIPHTQVAEYAAPIDPYDLAKVANFLGRLYGGKDEEGQALAIIEVYPGPGGPTQRTLLETYGYTNLYRWQYLDTGAPAQRSKFDFGWYSSKQSMQHLWTRGLRAIHRKQIIFRSDALVEELADCEMDLVRLRGSAASGGHDDRATAMLMAIWAANNWNFDIEPQSTHLSIGATVEWQSSDISSDRMQDAWDQRWEELTREADLEYS